MSMSQWNTIELRTIRDCIGPLENAIKYDNDIIQYLNQERLISDEHYDDLTSTKLYSPADKARYAVRLVRDKVKVNAKNYHKLMDYFHQDQDRYDSIIKTLNEVYKRNGGSPRPQPQVGTNPGTAIPGRQLRYYIIGCGIIVIALAVVFYTNKAGDEKMVPERGKTNSVPSITEPPTDSPCVEIDGYQKLQKVLEHVNEPLDKLCRDLRIKISVCNRLDQNRKLSAHNLAFEYMNQNPHPCWENIVKLLCKDLYYARLANDVATDHGIEFSKYC